MHGLKGLELEIDEGHFVGDHIGSDGEKKNHIERPAKGTDTRLETKFVFLVAVDPLDQGHHNDGYSYHPSIDGGGDVGAAVEE